jgi:hypothetical protein
MRGSNQGMAKSFSLLQSVQSSPGVHPASLLSGYQRSFPEVKRPGPAVDNSPPFGADVKYECSSTSAHPTRLQCLDREYFRFLSALEKLRRANVRFIVSVSVRPSAQNNSAPNGRIFIKFYTFVSLGVHLSCAH